VRYIKKKKCVCVLRAASQGHRSVVDQFVKTQAISGALQLVERWDATRSRRAPRRPSQPLGTAAAGEAATGEAATGEAVAADSPPLPPLALEGYWQVASGGRWLGLQQHLPPTAAALPAAAAASGIPSRTPTGKASAAAVASLPPMAPSPVEEERMSPGKNGLPADSDAVRRRSPQRANLRTLASGAQESLGGKVGSGRGSEAKGWWETAQDEGDAVTRPASANLPSSPAQPLPAASSPSLLPQRPVPTPIPPGDAEAMRVADYLMAARHVFEAFARAPKLLQGNSSHGGTSQSGSGGSVTQAFGAGFAGGRSLGHGLNDLSVAAAAAAQHGLPGGLAGFAEGLEHALAWAAAGRALGGPTAPCGFAAGEEPRWFLTRPAFVQLGRRCFAPPPDHHRRGGSSSSSSSALTSAALDALFLAVTKRGWLAAKRMGALDQVWARK
jgi:hypothetical protein